MKQFLKKGMSLVLVAVFLFPLSAKAYVDVPADSPYYYAVEFLRRAEVISDKTLTFKPDLIITKAEFIKYLVTLGNREFVPKKTGKLPFSDTRPTAWYASYFEEALKMGILSDREKTVAPFSKIDLPEALQLLFHSKSIPIPSRHVGTILFKDVAKNKKAAPLVMRALEMELFKPERADYVGIYKKLNKGQAASLIYRMELVNLGPPKFENENEVNAPAKTSGSDATDDFNFQKIKTAWDLVQKNYVHRDKINNVKMSDEAIRGMLKTLDDPYTTYMDQIENASFSDDLDGEIEGIGAMIGFNEAQELTIITPIVDTPAYRAGLKAGDVIQKVDETETKGLSLQKAVSLIKGPKGTAVTLTIKRGERTLVLSIVRDVIKVKAVESEIKDNGKAMYIRLSQFNQNAAMEFNEVASQMVADPRIQGIVLDLRDNPGGLLESAVDILNHFLKKETAVVHIQYNFFKYTQYATGNGALGTYPIVVLINKGSASASEIVAGALKDYGIATLVGETSFGKGTVQELNFFRDNSSIKVTVAEWLTPTGKSIEKNGIEPNLVVPASNGTAGEDAQLDRALEELRKLMNAR